MRAMQKLERKKCDLIVVNGPAAMHAADTKVEVIDARGEVLLPLRGANGRWPRPSCGSSTTRLIDRR